MRMVFRADASPQIGAGHVMRLSAIAEEAIIKGVECIFVGDMGGIQWLKDYVNNIGFSQMLAARSFSSVMGSQSVLVIDSYQIPVNEPSLNPENWSFVVAISDSQTPRYNSTLIVYPGMDTLLPGDNNSISLSGPKVIPFRKSISKFCDIRATPNPRLLIFGGGTDQYAMAPQIAHLIRQKYQFEEASFIYHHPAEIESMDSRFKVFPFGSILDSIIERSDLVITSASTSSFEVLARGVPTGIIRIVGNQDDNFRALGEAKLVSSIGVRSDEGLWNFSKHELDRLLLDANYREILRGRALKVFDFEGASRILEKISNIYDEGFESDGVFL